MKKLRVLVIVLAFVLGLSSMAFAGTDKETGFTDNQNDNARIYNGFYEENAQLIMKWSKDWIPMAHQTEGAWLTNHWEWYADSYSEGDFYGYDIRTDFGTGTYRITEFTKMKAVSDSEVPGLEAAGITVIWGNIAVLTDTIEIYDAATDALIETIIITQPAHPGFGNLKF